MMLSLQSICWIYKEIFELRNHLLLIQDGYEQLSKLDGQSLKGIIRVKFVNEQVSIMS